MSARDRELEELQRRVRELERARTSDPVRLKQGSGVLPPVTRRYQVLQIVDDYGTYRWDVPRFQLDE